MQPSKRRLQDDKLAKQCKEKTKMNAITQQQPHHPTFYVFLFNFYLIF